VKLSPGGKLVVIPFPFFPFTSHLNSHHFDVEHRKIHLLVSLLMISLHIL
jgi:hypothetical protein